MDPLSRRVCKPGTAGVNRHDPGPGATWRDCDPFWPLVQYSLDLDPAAMRSNEGEPVVQPFQLIFQDADGNDVTCDPAVAVQMMK